MIRFRDKPKDKAANAQATDAAATVAPASAAPITAAVENIAEAAAPLAKTEPEKSEDIKK